MKKLKLILLFLSLSGGGLVAQSTINAAGGGATVGGNTFDYSIGEMTLVSTESAANIVVTQGLLQPQRAAPDATSNFIISASQLSIYPNPTRAMLNLQPQFKSGGILSVVMLDMNGRIILKKDFNLASGTETQQIDINANAVGNYLLNVQFNNHKNTYKISKIK